MCEAVMDTGEERKPNWSLILPRKLEESRRYIWTSSRVTGRTALPGWSSRSPTRAHVQRTTASSMAGPFLPSPSARCGACSGRSRNKSRTLRSSSSSACTQEMVSSRFCCPQGTEKDRLYEVLKFRRVLETPRLALLTELCSCFTI